MQLGKAFQYKKWANSELLMLGKSSFPGFPKAMPRSSFAS